MEKHLNRPVLDETSEGDPHVICVMECMYKELKTYKSPSYVRFSGLFLRRT